MADQIVDMAEAVMPGPTGTITPQLEQLYEDTQKLHDETQTLTATTQKLQDDAVNQLITTDSKTSTSLFSSVTRVFDTVDAMSKALLLFAGMTCRTLGFHEAGDGGGALYHIVSDGDVNGMDVIACQHGLKASLVHDDPKVFNARQCGAYGDGEHDDGPVLEWLTSIGYTVYLPIGKYLCRRPLVLVDGCDLIGEPTHNSSIRKKSALLMYDLPIPESSSGSTQTVIALTLQQFNTIKDLSIIGNQCKTVENRDLLDPTKSNAGGWMSWSSSVGDAKIIGIESKTICLIDNVDARCFYTGMNLSSQGYAYSIMVRNCYKAYVMSGDMRGQNIQAYSCIQGLFSGGGNVEVSHLRFDGIYDYAFQIWNGGNFMDLNADFVGGPALVSYFGKCVVSNFIAGRCMLNHAVDDMSQVTTGRYEEYAIQIHTSNHMIFEGLKIYSGGRAADSSDSPAAKWKSPGLGIALTAHLGGENQPEFLTDHFHQLTASLDCEAIPASRSGNWSNKELDKLVYIDQSIDEDDRKKIFAYLRFRGSTIVVDGGVRTVK